jgi:hypothetical protein
MISRTLFCGVLPAEKQFHGKSLRVVIDQLGTVLAEPNPVGWRAPLFRCEFGVIAWTTR